MPTDGSRGSGDGTGGAGTVFTRQVRFDDDGNVEKGEGPFPEGMLTVNGGRPAGYYPPPDGTPIEDSWGSSGRRLVLSGEARVYAHTLEFGEIDVTEGSTLTTPPSDPIDLADSSLGLATNRLIVGPTSQVSVSGRGYEGGDEHDENGYGAGQTAAGIEPATQQFGGSHGGVGGSDVLSGGSRREGAHAGGTYDDPEHPTSPGAGGAADAEPSGAHGNPGGGALEIEAQSIDDEGVISADGQSSAGPTVAEPTPFDRSTGDGGAGGSIVLVAGALAGHGSISAAGGSTCLQVPPLLLGGHAACPRGSAAGAGADESRSRPRAPVNGAGMSRPRKAQTRERKGLRKRRGRGRRADHEDAHDRPRALKPDTPGCRSRTRPSARCGQRSPWPSCPPPRDHEMVIRWLVPRGA